MWFTGTTSIITNNHEANVTHIIINDGASSRIGIITSFDMELLTLDNVSEESVCFYLSCIC